MSVGKGRELTGRGYRNNYLSPPRWQPTPQCPSPGPAPLEQRGQRGAAIYISDAIAALGHEPPEPPQQRRPQTPWQQPTDGEWRRDEWWRTKEGEEREWQQPSGEASSLQDRMVDSAWRDMQVAFGSDQRPSDWWSSHSGWSSGQGHWEATNWRWVEHPPETNPWEELS